MNSSQDASRHMEREMDLMMNAIEILDEEKQSILSEVLKCDVCLELPKGKQVKICEKGHHFCNSCHTKMNFCGICRGRLLESRNFVVEELVAKLGPILGITSKELPIPQPPPKLCRGQFLCLHQCCSKLAAFQMLSHIRGKHPSNLLDNVRSNPYSGCFSFTYNVTFTQNENYIWSVQVSDMGLFTIQITFSNLDLLGCVRVLGDKTVSSLFNYQLVIRIPKRRSHSTLEFSMSDSPVLGYSEKSKKNVFKVKSETLLEHIEIGSVINVFISIWRIKKSTKKRGTSVVCAPERNLYFENDRKIRRTRNRNMRRKRLKDKLKNSEDVMKSLSENFRELEVAF